MPPKTETLMEKYRFQAQIINRSMNGIIACGMDDFIRIINPAAPGDAGAHGSPGDG